MGNRELKFAFRTLSELMVLHGDKEHLARSFASAAFRISNLNENVLEMSSGQLSKNFHREVAATITALKVTGTIERLEELIQLTPPGVFEMMRIKGLGGKKLAVLWKKAGIDSMDALLEACRKNKITGLPGFGTKTQENILRSIEEYKSHENRFHYATVEETAATIVALLRKVYDTEQIDLCGEVRRKCNTVERIEILCAVPFRKFKAGKSSLHNLVIDSLSEVSVTGHTINEIPFSIHFTSPALFYWNLFFKTGNEQHVKKVSKNLSSHSGFKSEADIYSKAGLKFIVPEMREDVAEWEFIKRNKNEDLIIDQDIRGVVHNHTTFSDGIDTLKDFADACRKKKYEYVVISDHSKNAFYAGGLKEEDVIRQHSEIDLLNKKMKPFRIFKSIECDILISGELDFPDSFLKKFDLVIVSIHQLLKMDEEKATRRLIKAIENPYTTILGHMTGRQHLIRSGYPVDFKKVIDVCAANKVIIEINANPYRLDMDWSHISYAIKKGVMISVNPDAHSIGEIDNIHWGIQSARKGGLTKHMTWNAMPLKDVEKWIAVKRKAISSSK